MDNRRLLLLLVFSFSLVMLWDAWQKYNQPKPAATAAVSTPQAPAPQLSTNLHAPLPVLPDTAAVRAPDKAETFTVKTDLFVAHISRIGGDIVRLELNDYKDSTNKQKDFALFEAKHQYVAQSGLIGEGLPNHKTSFSAVAGSAELGADAKTVVLRLEAPAGGGLKVAKTYTFTRGSYLIDEERLRG